LHLAKRGFKITKTAEKGLGVIATRRFANDELLGYYKCDSMTKEEIDGLYGKDITAPYAVHSKGDSSDGRDYHDAAANRCYLSLVNAPSKGETANAELLHDDSTNLPVMRTTRVIEEGEEICASYGKRYKFSHPNVTHFTREKYFEI